MDEAIYEDACRAVLLARLPQAGQRLAHAKTAP
jgi:hypothetical protein